MQMVLERNLYWREWNIHRAPLRTSPSLSPVWQWRIMNNIHVVIRKNCHIAGLISFAFFFQNERESRLVTGRYTPFLLFLYFSKMLQSHLAKLQTADFLLFI